MEKEGDAPVLDAKPSSGSFPERQPPAEVIRLRRRWLLVTFGIPGAVGLLALASLLFYSVRAWSYNEIVLPLVADVLGRDRLLVDGEPIRATFPAWVQFVFVLLALLFVLNGWAALITRRSLGTPWVERIRIDGPFLLATLPYIGLGVVLHALGEAQLFTFPVAFLSVLPIVFLTVAVVILASLAASLWIESAGGGGFPKRFLFMTLVLFVTRAILVESGLVAHRGLPWWGYAIPPLVGYAAFFGVTLGNRLVTHRRVLFSLGLEQFVFLTAFLVSWTIQGPWPGLDAPHLDNLALRVFEVPALSRIYVTMFPVMGFTFGMYTFGSFLHSYLRAARPWASGLNLAVLFGQMLEGWVLTVAVQDPYDAGGPFLPKPAGWAGALMDSIGGWGYVLAKFAFVLVVIHLVDRTFRDQFAGRAELANLLKGTLFALGLIPGLRVTIMLVIGF